MTKHRFDCIWTSWMKNPEFRGFSLISMDHGVTNTYKSPILSTSHSRYSKGRLICSDSDFDDADGNESESNEMNEEDDIDSDHSSGSLDKFDM